VTTTEWGLLGAVGVLVALLIADRRDMRSLMREVIDTNKALHEAITNLRLTVVERTNPNG
jgi:hypothetical protein